MGQRVEEYPEILELKEKKMKLLNTEKSPYKAALADSKCSETTQATYSSLGYSSTSLWRGGEHPVHEKSFRY